MTFSLSALLDRVSMTAGQIALLAALPLAAAITLAHAF
jgi:hypothetical protein